MTAKQRARLRQLRAQRRRLESQIEKLESLERLEQEARQAQSLKESPYLQNWPMGENREEVTYRWFKPGTR
jgi:hypothetical protein